jgi:peptidoglycan hydrolase-like protein with peptidoglycan-binding domain
MSEEKLEPEKIVAEPVIEEVKEVEEVKEFQEPIEPPEPPKPAPAKPAPVKQEQKYATPVSVTTADIEELAPTPAGPAVVGYGLVDEVYLDKIVYKNLYARKSLSVHHMQRRLAELGYVEAAADKDGYYGDMTKSAVAKFQAENNLNGDGTVDAETFTLLFTGDINVKAIV